MATTNVNGPVTVNVTELIDQNRLSGFQKRIVVLCALLLFFDGYDIASLSTVLPLLAESLKVKVSLFGGVFVIGSVGILIGNFILGSLADRFGRKWMTIISTLICGFGMLLTPYVNSFQLLFVVRFIQGFGIGGAMPNAMAMVSEYAPKRSRSFLMTLTFTGVPIGGASAHFLGALFIKHFGWPWVFYFGSMVPFALCIISVFALPEAIQFMVNKNYAPERIGQLLRKMYGKFTAADVPEGAEVKFVLAEAAPKGKVPLAEVMKEGRASLTILAWIANFMTLMVAVYITSWFPTVLRLNGVPVTTGNQIAGLFQVGAVCGTPIIGRMMDRVGPARGLMYAYMASVVFVASFGFAGKSLVLLAIVTFWAGFSVYGTQAGLLAFIGPLYPVSMRATGLGWVFAVGRSGHVLGPIVGAVLVAQRWPLAEMFMIAAVPALIATICLVSIKRIVQKREKQAAASQSGPSSPSGGGQTSAAPAH